MDADGHANDRGQCELCLTREKLIDGAHELILSLGIKCSKVESRATLNGRDFGPKWTLKFLTGLPAFRLERKLKRQKRGGFRGTVGLRYITSVEPVESEPVRCITVDSPSSLYLVGRHR